MYDVMIFWYVLFGIFVIVGFLTILLNIHIDMSDEGTTYIWYGRKERKNIKIRL